MVSYIKLGKAVYEDDRGVKPLIYFTEKGTFGTAIVAARARYGKSCLTNILMSKLSLYRKLIIFDYRGEHRLNRFANFNSKDDIVNINKLNIIENFAFKPKDFNTIEDWTTLGFTSNASNALVSIAKTASAEYFDTFYNEVEDNLPDIHSETLKNIKTNMDLLKRDKFFIMNGKDTRNYISNWENFLADRYNHLIDMNMGDTGNHYAQANVGKILAIMGKRNCWYLAIYKPCFIFEEADLLFPEDVDKSKPLPSSIYYIDKYVLKFQKNNVECIFIIQDLDKLFNSIVRNNHTWFIGHVKLNSNTQLGFITQLDINRLTWSPSKNIRHFIIIDEKHPRGKVFIPDDVCCYYHGVKTGYDKLLENEYNLISKKILITL